MYPRLYEVTRADTLSRDRVTGAVLKGRHEWINPAEIVRLYAWPSSPEEGEQTLIEFRTTSIIVQGSPRAVLASFTEQDRVVDEEDVVL